VPQQPFHAGINLAKIPVTAGFAGAVFAIGTLSILVIGIPELQLMLPAAITGGVAVAAILRLLRREPH
jgi:hypothetical protein